MPGPIASAFIDIKARLSLEDGGELEKGLRSQIRRIESDLERLEGAAAQSGRAIGRQLSDVRIDLNVREALGALERVDNAVESVTGEINNLRDQDLGFGTAAATRNLKTLDERIAKIMRAVQLVDDEEVSLNVKDAVRNLEVLDRAVSRLTTELSDLARAQPDLDFSAAANDLQNLEEEIGNALRDLGRLDGKRVQVNVEDLEVDALTRKVERLDGESIDLRIETSGLRGANEQLRIAEDRAGALKGAFSRIVAFGLIREAGQAIGQLFAAGVRASGAIQVATVTLNRFFAQTRDLGQTSSEFLGNLRKLALETPFEFEGLAETSRRILAMGVDADDTVGIMTELADAVAAVGGGQGEIDGVVRALSQLSSKGRVDLQDFRQISENLPSLSRQMQIQGVIDELNELHPGLNATIADFEDLRKSGQITGKVLRDGIIRAIGDIPGVAGAARAASRTLQGSLSNLADFATIEFSRAFAGLGGIIADELNAAFGSVTEGDALTPLAAAIRQVIDSFGRAGESTLPGILEGIADIAPDVATLVEAVATAIENLTPLLTNLSSGGLTAFTGLTSILTSVVQLINLLPVGLQETLGGFITLATVIPGAGETIKNSFVQVGVALKAVLAGEKAVALGAAVMNAALTAGLLIGVTLITQQMAKASQRSDEFKQSISAAAQSLQEFETFGEGVLDFINQFRVEGEGVNIGGLEEFLDGLTTGEIEDALGATTQQVATLVGELSKAGKEISDAEYAAALEEAGISTEAFKGASDDAIVSIQALSTQVALGSERAFDAALASQEFAFVTDEVAASIAAAADSSGDYVTGLEKLETANQNGAKAELDHAKARGATQAQIDAAIAGNTDLETGTIDYIGALQELNGELQKQETLFQGLQERYRGFTETINGLSAAANIAADSPGALGERFVDFALAIDKAQLSADEMNAIANELGTTLGQVFSGDELTKVVGAFVADIDAFKSSLEGVVPGIADIQLEADGFSLNKFLDELNRLTEARFRVSGNITRLLNEFGTVGTRALEALLNSGLSKDQFAIALEQGIAGGEEKLSEIADRFAAVTGPQIQELAERLAAQGFNEERINEILGVDAFAGGVSDLNTEVDGLDPVITNLEGKISRLEGAIARAESPNVKRELSNILSDTKNQLEGVQLDNPSGIDLPAATAAADAAGTDVGTTYTTSIQTTIAASTADVSAAISNQLRALTGGSAAAAISAGITIARLLAQGFTLGALQISGSLQQAVGIATLSILPRLKVLGRSMSSTLVESYDKGLFPALDDSLNDVLKAFGIFGNDADRELRLAAELSVSTFQQTLDGLSDVASRETAETVQIFRVAGLVMSVQAAVAGRQTTIAFDTGLSLTSVASKELSGVSKAFSGPSFLRTQAFNSGRLIGFDFGRGVAAGISASVNEAIKSMIRLISATFSAAENYAQISSPSKLFAKPGFNMGAGIAAGLISSIPQVAAAAAAVVAAAEGRASSSVTVPTRIIGNGLNANPLAAGALRRLSDGQTAAPGTATTPAGAGVTHNHTWNVSAPTDDPEALALKVAARLESRLDL